jgi:hypothetical protein
MVQSSPDDMKPACWMLLLKKLNVLLFFVADGIFIYLSYMQPGVDCYIFILFNFLRSFVPCAIQAHLVFRLLP